MSGCCEKLFVTNSCVKYLVICREGGWLLSGQKHREGIESVCSNLDQCDATLAIPIAKWGRINTADGLRATF